MRAGQTRARFFNFEDWHVKNIELDKSLSPFTAFVSRWVMPLFFMLSGMSSHHSLKRRSAGRYIANRFQRLVVPLVFGIFIFLVPVQVWIERASHGQFHGGFLEFYPRYFDGLCGFGGNFAWMGLRLWYLEMLFVFTLFTCPLFVGFQRPRALDRMAAAAALCGRRVPFCLSACRFFWWRGWSIFSRRGSACGVSAALVRDAGLSVGSLPLLGAPAATDPARD